MKLIRKGLDVNHRDESGGTVLLYACSYNDLKSVKTLVNAGADVNIQK